MDPVAELRQQLVFAEASAAGEPFILETNTLPGMTEASLVPKAAGAAGIPLSTLVSGVLLSSVLPGSPKVDGLTLRT